MLSTPQISPYPARLATQLAALRRRIDAAATASGRAPETITLLAVSKGHPPAALFAARDLGLTDFGENYLDEALPKIVALGREGPTPCWHFIGRLQANKTRPVATHFDWVHGVDRLRIAERLSAHRGHFQPPLNVCVQVNVAGESSKAGVAPEQCATLLEAVAALPRLRLRGLMCMLPYEAGAAEQAQGFGTLRRLFERARRAGLPLDTLSMGMSADLEAAIEQGSTLLRIGTALFGPRPDRPDDE
jgi:pyridoxal phosphate enzyme (YggS family)